MIPMQQDFNIEYVVGGENVLQNMAAGSVSALPIFSERVLCFLHAFSKMLLQDRAARAFSDVMTFGFWCRRANIREMMRDYDDFSVRIGRGTVLHIAPSNVAVNFAYSFVTALLAGNASIVRLPSKDFPQVGIICRVLNVVLEKFSDMQAYCLMMRYGHEKDITDFLSSICQTRIIWGGDKTIADIRTSPLPPRSNEITFADRCSLAIIDSSAYLRCENKADLANKFYNDTYLSDQNACTSPSFVIWLGNDVGAAQCEFWQNLHVCVKDKYELKPVQAVDKLAALYRLGIAHDVRLVKSEDNFITRISIRRLTADLLDYKLHSGFFMEYVANEVEDMLPLCGIACQTVSYYGVDGKWLRDKIFSMTPAGVDRIVPIGQTMDFGLVWDGHDLVREMSRRIVVY